MASKRRITRETIRHLEFLSRLSLKPEEEQRMVEDLRLLLRYIDEVLLIEAEGREPYYYASPGHLREDERMDWGASGRTLLEGSVMDKGFVVAPSVVERDEKSG